MYCRQGPVVVAGSLSIPNYFTWRLRGFQMMDRLLERERVR
jgi:hypothetical protein